VRARRTLIRARSARFGHELTSLYSNQQRLLRFIGDGITRVEDQPVEAGSAGKLIVGAVVEDRAGAEPIDSADTDAGRQCRNTFRTRCGGIERVANGCQGELVIGEAVIRGCAGDEDAVAARSDEPIGADAADGQDRRELSLIMMGRGASAILER
jgi:hypothetical protein